MARHGGLHVTGSYRTGGRSSRCFSGVYSADMGTTVRVASMREDGQTFHDSRTPARELHTKQFVGRLVRTVALLDVLKVEHDGE